MNDHLLSYLTPNERVAWERSQKATKGPWKTTTSTNGSQWNVRVNGGLFISPTLTPDLAFIVHARTDLPAALTTLAETRAVLAEHEFWPTGACLACCNLREPMTTASSRHEWKREHKPGCWLNRLLHPAAVSKGDAG